MQAVVTYSKHFTDQGSDSAICRQKHHCFVLHSPSAPLPISMESYRTDYNLVLWGELIDAVDYDDLLEEEIQSNDQETSNTQSSFAARKRRGMTPYLILSFTSLWSRLHERHGWRAAVLSCSWRQQIVFGLLMYAPLMAASRWAMSLLVEWITDYDKLHLEPRHKNFPIIRWERNLAAFR